MIYIKQLSDCLTEWNNEVGEERVTQFGGLISSLTIRIGHVEFNGIEFQTNPVLSLEKLLIKFTEPKPLLEEILVDGILFNIYSYLKRNISGREDAIRNNEILLENAEKLDPDDVDNIKCMILSTLERLQSPDYIKLAEREIKVWEKVYDNYFNTSEREKLGRENEKLMMKAMEKNMSDGERQQIEEIKAKIRN